MYMCSLTTGVFNLISIYRRVATIVICQCVDGVSGSGARAEGGGDEGGPGRNRGPHGSRQPPTPSRHSAGTGTSYHITVVKVP